MPSLAELAGMQMAQAAPSLQSLQEDTSWMRQDGTRKGQGFLGPLRFHDGRTSTELSVGVNLDGKDMEIPTLVPTLSPNEIQHLLRGGTLDKGNPVADSIVQKAMDHARMRMQGKLPVFAP